MKNIVFVSALQIFPPMSGGQLRSAHLSRALARLGYNVEIYSLTGRKQDYIGRKADFTQQVDSGLAETVNMNPLWGLLQFIAYRLGLPPFWVTLLLRVYQPVALKKLLQTADKIILDFPFLYPLLDHHAGPAWINTHNAEFELWTEKSWVSGIVKTIEVAAFKKAQHIIFCSERDQNQFLGSLPSLQDKSTVVANGVDVTAFRLPGTVREETRSRLHITPEQSVFIFTGSTYHPNQEALAFLRSFCTTHREKLVEMKVVILVVGTVSEQLLDEDCLKILGKVPDIMPYFAAADFGLNPVALGSGVNVKMVEFVAAGLPVLTTEFGCRGFSLSHGESCYIFEREQLLKAMIEILELSDMQRKGMASKAFCENESRIDMSKALEQLLKKQMNCEE